MERPACLHRGGFPIQSTLLSCAIAVAAVLAPTGATALPTPPNCQIDPGGANDRPGQRDVTRFCIDVGDGAPYDLLALMNCDEITLNGNNTIDVCLLFNRDGDAFADLAVCATLHRTEPDDLAGLQNLRLFTCTDTRADRCTGSVLIAGPYDTTCEVSVKPTDPFSPAAIDGPGAEYPSDTEILCGVVLDDFGVGATSARLLDTCSYPSQVVNSDPDDCILYQGCDNADDCNDANPCTIDSCDPSGVCEHDPAGPVACSDGLYCNGDEVCNEVGFCTPGSGQRNCDDGVNCTIDDCDELDDTCVHDPRNSLCDNATYCDGVETCDLVNGCTDGVDINCDDGVSCTTDQCNEGTDACEHVANDDACDDGLYCNGESTCDLENGCIAGPLPDCDDSIACTVDACDENTDACISTPNNEVCSDGLFCSGTETCGPAGCVPGVPPNCDDQIACTADSCNENTDLCTHTPNHDSCSNGTFCDGVEACDPDQGCVNGSDPCVAPAICSEDLDMCVECLIDAHCDNGVFCDGAETCNTANGTCSDAADPNCDDGVTCTIDTCDEIGNVCAHEPSNALCDNQLFCDGVESCDLEAGCIPSDPPCNDGIACTVDACVEETSTCTYTANDDLCDDGVYCDGEEVCNTTNGCLDTASVVCPGDGVNCTVEYCNEDTDSCLSDADDCVCGDGEVTAGEQCEPPLPAGTFEDCNNEVNGVEVDDDGDGRANCHDPDCAPNSTRGIICDEGCQTDALCAEVAKDPALIRFNRDGGPDEMWLHGRFPIGAQPNPSVEGFHFQVSNDVQPIYRASLAPGEMTGNSSGTRYVFKDPDAAVMGSESSSGGLSRIGIIFRDVKGVRYLSFRIRLYGDFSTATHRMMTTQVGFGGTVGSLNEEWAAKPDRWVLRQSKF